MLRDLLAKELEYTERDGASFLDAVRNAAVVANAERYYRVMYYGGAESWNLRDRHMFETLEALLRFHGAGSKAVVWEHNSHLGDAAATEMGVRGEINVGHLCRQAFGPAAFLIGFGTDHGTVAAAHEWDGPMQVMDVRAAHPESYERRLPRGAASAAGVVHLREPARARGARRARAAAARARHRRRLPAGHRAPEPLLPRHAAAPVRRVHLVRRDQRGAAGDRGDGARPADDASVRALRPPVSDRRGARSPVTASVADA